MKKSLATQPQQEQINCELFAAIRNDNPDKVLELLNNGAQLTARNEDRETPLHSAVSEGNLDLIDLLLRCQANVNSVGGNDNVPPLHYTNDIEIVRKLIEYKANVNDADKYGDIPLHYAVLEKDMGMMQLLLAKKANINAQNRFGDTPLHFARGQEMAQYLITNRADINLRNDQENTPLDSIQETEEAQKLLGLVE